MCSHLQPYVRQVPSAEVTSQAARKLHSAASVLKSHARTHIPTLTHAPTPSLALIPTLTLNPTLTLTLT